MPSFDSPTIDRRTFLFAGFVAAIGFTSMEQSPRLETFTEWLNATASARERALSGCLDHIRTMDPSIHAWVQVEPEKPTGTGKLSGIPFGVKDIIETRGLSTAYGSPVYDQATKLGLVIPTCLGLWTSVFGMSPRNWLLDFGLPGTWKKYGNLGMGNLRFTTVKLTTHRAAEPRVSWEPRDSPIADAFSRRNCSSSLVSGYDFF